MSSDIYFSSLQKLVYLIKNKQITCTEIIKIYLNRIANINPTLNALVQISHLKALEHARTADEIILKKNPVGPLHGIPITIKDCCKVKDFIITKGSTGFQFTPNEDAMIVARLKRAGAIIIGISNVPEFNIAYETNNDRYGKTLNPYDLKRTPGGSSGGEAAIISAGGSSFGLGTDAGGSIRQPAHNTGIVSLKPTAGLFPNTGKLPNDKNDLLNSLTSYGPMARFVDDLILTLPILAGMGNHRPNIAHTILKKPLDFKTLRIAFYINNNVVKPDEDTIQTIKKVVNNLQSDVAQLREHCPPHLPELYSLISETIFLKGDKGLGLKKLLKKLNISRPSSLINEFLAIARRCEFSPVEFKERLIRLKKLRLDLASFFKNYDIIICPVAATPAKFHGRSFIEGKDFSYLSVYNLTGWPVVTVRCGTSLKGLPISIQIIAKPFHETTALNVAKKIEILFGGWIPPPLFL